MRAAPSYTGYPFSIFSFSSACFSRLLGLSGLEPPTSRLSGCLLYTSTRFPIAHIEKAYGSAQENRDYIRKDGKWKDTEKSETVVPDTFFEWGHMPDIREEKAPKLFQLIQDVQAGISTTDILHNTPDFRCV